jgi:hypothetical protein
MSKKRNHPYKRRRGGFPDTAHPEAEGRESPAHGAAPHGDDAEVIAVRRVAGDGTRRRAAPSSSAPSAKAPAPRTTRARPSVRPTSAPSTAAVKAKSARPSHPSRAQPPARPVSRPAPEPNVVANAARAVRESESRTPVALLVRAWRAVGHAIGAPRRWWRETIALLRERAADR